MKKEEFAKNEVKNKLHDMAPANPGDKYTIVGNDVVLDSRLSLKALGLLLKLLSNRNKKGWKTYTTSLMKSCADGKDSIYTGIKELVKYGYLIKVQYYTYSKKTGKKVRAGVLYRYDDTPYNFNIEKIFKSIEASGFLPAKGELLKTYPIEEFPLLWKGFKNRPKSGLPKIGKPVIRKSATIKNNIKKKKKKKEERDTIVSLSATTKKNSNIDTSSKNAKYVKIATKLWKLINSNQTKQLPKIRISQWSNDIRLLAEANKVPKQRIKEVLKWYSKNIGKKFTPVIASGKSFRDKFEQLEAAIKRDKQQNKSGITVGYLSKKKAKIVKNITKYNG